jgi:acyl dehydratase
MAEGAALDTRALTGKRLGPYCSFNPVSQVQIWQWCSVMGDANPLYLDENYRAGTEFDRAVAPPAMMQMWTMRDCNMQYAPGSTDAPPYAIFDILAEHGFPGNVAVSYDIRFHRYLQEGDRAQHYTTVVNISDLKETGLGEGYFVTERVEYLDQEEALFAEALITYFQYRPQADTGEPQADKTEFTDDAPSPGPRAAAEQAPMGITSGDLKFADLYVDQSLPELVIPITHRLIVGGAMATQDFIDVHHNVPAARAAAMPDIFMNILTTCGLCARYLSDWAGPASRLEKLSFKLLAPNLPGDSMVMQGRVAGLDTAAEQERVSVDFAGKNGLGFHVTGAATLRLT